MTDSAHQSPLLDAAATSVIPPPGMPLNSDVDTTFQSLLEAAPDAIVIVDRDGRIAITNGQTERLFGYDRSELVGQPVECLLPERIRSRHVHHAPTIRPSRIPALWASVLTWLPSDATGASFQSKSA